MEKILSYIEDTYAPAALFVYGSRADGSAGPAATLTPWP